MQWNNEDYAPKLEFGTNFKHKKLAKFVVSLSLIQ